jgi:hypothetical protein
MSRVLLVVAATVAALWSFGGSAFAAAPVAETTVASEITSQTAKLAGRVDPQGSATTYWFEYGATASYGQRVPAVGGVDAGSDSGSIPVYHYANGLERGQAYHFRVVAENLEGTTAGGDQTFRVPEEAAVDPGLSPEVRPGAVPGKGFLPDGRAWEKVTPDDKGGLDVGGDSYLSMGRPAVQGGGLTYHSFGVFAGAAAGGYPSVYIANRNAAGDWVNRGLNPPSVATAVVGRGAGGRTSTVTQIDPTLRTAIVETSAPIAPGTVRGVPSLFKLDVDSGSLSLVNPGAPSYQQALSIFGAPADFVTATPDGTHVLFNSRYPYTADSPPDRMKLYEAVNGAVRLAGVLPDGSVPDTAYAGWDGPSVNKAISDDGRRVYFSTLSDGTGGPLYLREGGQTTVVSPNSSRFYSATADGRYALYIENTPDGAGGSAPSLIRYDAETGGHETLSGAISPGSVQAASDDLEYVYFATTQASGGLPASLYLAHGGQVSHVATFENNRDEALSGPAEPPYGVYPDFNSWINRRFVQWTPDGRTVVFATTAKVTSYDSGGFREVYRYDVDGDRLQCLSCPEGDATADAGMGTTTPASTSVNSVRLGPTGAISQDGSQVVFETADALVPSDSNGHVDVYRWRDGRVELLSDGRSAADARFLGASGNGADVFFATRSRLGGGDRDDLVDIYDARVGGGRPEPAASQPPCLRDACQGPPVPVPAPAAPQTDGVRADDPTPPVRARVTVQVSSSARRLLAAGRTATIEVSVSKAGRVSVRGTAKVGGKRVGVLSGHVTARQAGKVKVRLRLSSAARRQLRKSGRLTVTLTTTFGNQRPTVNLSLRSSK